ncbi:MAG: sulfite exporter TauE/SafE family protein [Marinovum sp.]|nr:sulfite exporter TauE/SafE family protein [Marinovum sp.]
MLEMDALFFIFAIPAVVFAGISKGGFGSGAAFAGSSILALVLPPAQALGIMLPLLMLIDVAALRPYWGKWNWLEARALLWGGFPGVLLGVALWRVASDDVIRLFIGTISLGFVVWQVTAARVFRATYNTGSSSAWGYVAGTIAGFTSFISHAGGPPVAVYLLSRGMEKTEYQASTVLVFWVVNIMKAIPYGILGIFSVQTLLANLYLAPFALTGTWLGVLAHRVISAKLFFTVTYAMLTITGSKLIWDALT